MARLTDQQWDSVKADYITGRYSTRALAEKHGVSHVAIQKKLKAEDWAGSERRDVVKGHDPFTPGFIYVLSFRDMSGERFCKIGMAKNLESRIASIQTSLPFKLKIEMCFYSENMAKTEKEMHAEFSDERVAGEWFRLTDNQLMSIRSYCYRG